MRSAPLLAVLMIAGLHGQAWAATSSLRDVPFSAPQVLPPSVQPQNRQSLQARAEAGEAEAQYRLGLSFQLGLGGPRDLAQARHWFGRAAAQDHALGLGGLGFLMLLGQGGPADIAGAEKALTRAGEKGEASALANLAELKLQRDGAAALPEAVALLERAIAQGAVNARYRLGVWLYEGVLLPADRARGLVLLREAAAADNPLALTYLGFYHTIGLEGIEQDRPRGFAMMKRAAEMGYADAENEVGRCYAYGVGVAEDAKAAAEWYRRAMAQDQPDAPYNLGLLYKDGKLPGDPAEQRRLFGLGAQAGIAPSMTEFALMLRNSQGGPRDLEGSVAWLTKAAELGDAQGQNRLASILFNGQGVPADPVRGMDWWEKAAEQNYPSAINNFATYLATGRGRAADPERARAMLAKLSAEGVARTSFRLGLWHEAGYAGTPKDLKRALELFKLAAEQGSGRGAFKYAAYLEAGQGLPADPKAALDWYRRAAALGNGDALFLLARYSFNGDGLPQDTAEAMRLLRQAAARGHREALLVMGNFLFRGENVTADPALAWAHWAVAERLGLAEAGANRRAVETRLGPDQRLQAQAAAEVLLAQALVAQGEDE